jgi:hypothetical protein
VIPQVKADTYKVSFQGCKGFFKASLHQAELCGLCELSGLASNTALHQLWQVVTTSAYHSHLAFTDVQ